MRWIDWLLERTGMAVGAIFGFLLGLIFLFAGFWKMIGFALIMLLGIIIGVLWDRQAFDKLIHWFKSRKRGRRF